jgi:hypothetical protein
MEEFLKKEIELLPQEARKLLGEFCEFLLKKYEKKLSKTLPKGFYHPIKVESFSKVARREEIYGE